MTKYRKKPVVVEAFKYDGNLIGRDGEFYVPDWAEKAYKEGVLFYNSFFSSPFQLFIDISGGAILIDEGDYVIKGDDGKLSSCSLYLFKMNYEEIKEWWYEI